MNELFEPRFCYRITGNHTPQYTQTYFDGGKQLPKETYDTIHRNLKFTLSNEMGIPPQRFVCITQEEYDLHESSLEVS